MVSHPVRVPSLPKRWSLENYILMKEERLFLQKEEEQKG
jgi:hypothetical protein